MTSVTSGETSARENNKANERSEDRDRPRLKGKIPVGINDVGGQSETEGVLGKFRGESAERQSQSLKEKKRKKESARHNNTTAASSVRTDGSYLRMMASKLLSVATHNTRRSIKYYEVIITPSFPHNNVYNIYVI